MNPFHKTTIGKPKKWLIEAAAEIGLDYSELSHDLAIVGSIRKGELRNVYVKMEPGITYLYFDKVLNSNRNKVLRGSTFFKIVKSLDMENLERIVNMNGKSDLSNAKKIIAAGGHPGDEA